MVGDAHARDAEPESVEGKPRPGVAKPLFAKAAATGAPRAALRSARKRSSFESSRSSTGKIQLSPVINLEDRPGFVLRHALNSCRNVAAVAHPQRVGRFFRERTAATLTPPEVPS